MDPLLYTQATGFSLYSGTSLTTVPELSAIDSSKDLIRAAGYVDVWEYGAEYPGDEVMGYTIEGENRYGLPRFLTTYWDVCNGQHIYCNDAADFFALRLELIRSQHVVGLPMNALYELAKKAFQAIHGHGEDGVCERCDPDEMERRRERARRRRQGDLNSAR